GVSAQREGVKMQRKRSGGLSFPLSLLLFSVFSGALLIGPSTQAHQEAIPPARAATSGFDPSRILAGGLPMLNAMRFSGMANFASCFAAQQAEAMGITAARLFSEDGETSGARSSAQMSFIGAALGIPCPQPGEVPEQL